MRISRDNNTTYLGLGLLWILVFMIPYVVNGKDCYITISDNLEGSFAHLKCIFSTDSFFDYDSELPILDGIPRSSIPYSSPFELKPLINYCFPGIDGVLINMFFVKLLAVWGMWIFLFSYVLKNKNLAFVFAVLYSITPFCTNYGLSSAGIPLLLYALLNIKDYKRIVLSYIIVALYAVYSYFVLSGVFVCGLFALAILYLLYKDRKLHWGLITALLILCLGYLISNWSVVYNFLTSSGFVSHRREWVQVFSWYELFKEILKTISIGQWHAGEVPALPILFLFMFVYAKYSSRYRELKLYMNVSVILISLIIIGIVLTYVSSIPFNISRFYFLYPALCFGLFAKSFEILFKNRRKLAVVIALLFIIPTAAVFSRSKEYLYNIQKCLDVDRADVPSFAQFYDSQLFHTIAADLKVPQDFSIKVVSVAMYPAVTEYNGFWCLDGYFVSYPLEYKHQFRKIIIDELKKSNSIKSYYDDWGSRCYIFPASLNTNCLISKYANIELEDLNIDTEILKNMGCQYIFSAVKIKNLDKINLKFVNSYSLDKSYYRIYVYQLS